jgi:DNA-directed RNA polymerase subunit RPC12/RpoP
MLVSSNALCQNGLGGSAPNLEGPVIDTLLNLLFRCSHRRLTRPLTAAGRKGEPHGRAYVVCLDCGKQFDYDLKAMRMGKAIPPAGERPHGSKVKYGIIAGMPLVVAIGAWLKRKD